MYLTLCFQTVTIRDFLRYTDLQTNECRGTAQTVGPKMGSRQ